MTKCLLKKSINSINLLIWMLRIVDFLGKVEYNYSRRYIWTGGTECVGSCWQDLPEGDLGYMLDL